MRIETKRLILREMTENDLPALRKILQDEEVMYAYEHAFSEEEVIKWFENQRRRYREDGFGLWAAVLKDSEEMIGQCGITYQDIGTERVPETGYLFQKKFWHSGYAAEAAQACNRYAFDVLGMSEIYSIIRDNNLPSRKVAERNGMEICGSITKHYYGIDMPHLVYRLKRQTAASKIDN